MTLIESVLIIGSVIGGLITTSCWNIRRSRCETIESPCVSCMRKPMNEKEMKLDVSNNANMNRTVPCCTSLRSEENLLSHEPSSFPPFLSPPCDAYE